MKAPSAVAPRPILPPEVPQFFVPVRGMRPTGETLIYQPKLLGAAAVRFVNKAARVDYPRELVQLADIDEGAVTVDWQNSTEAAFELDEVEREPAEDAVFGPLPAEATKTRSYAAWSRNLVTWLYGNQTLELLKSQSLKETSQPGESERDFRVRLQQAGREKRDENVEKLRRAYAPKIAVLEERIRRAEQAAEREREQASQQKMQTAVSIGATLLGAFLGRKAVSTSTMGRAATAARAGTRAWKEAQDVTRAVETVEALRQQLSDLEAQFAAEAQALELAMGPATETFDTVAVKLKKSNITVRLVALCWMPHWKDSQGNVQPAF